MDNDQIKLQNECKNLMFEILAQFQFIEAGTKNMLIHYYKSFAAMSRNIIGQDTFLKHREEKEYERKTLGTLIDMLEEITGKTKFIRGIRKILPERNRLAHKGFLLLRDKTLPEDLPSMKTRLILLQQEIHDCEIQFLIELANNGMAAMKAQDIRIMSEEKYPPKSE